MAAPLEAVDTTGPLPVQRTWRAYAPNGLTILRLALLPLFVWLLLGSADGQSLAAALVFLGAALTDQLDGYLARRWRVESRLGKYADPLADRLMIDAAVVLLWLEGRLPWPVPFLVLARDAVLLSGARLALKHGYDFAVSTLGKTATWVLFAALLAVMLTPAGTVWAVALVWGGVALAVLAGLVYLVEAARRRPRRSEKSEEREERDA